MYACVHTCTYVYTHLCACMRSFAVSASATVVIGALGYPITV